MIDEEKAKAEAAAHETATQTVAILEATLAEIAEGMAAMMAGYISFQATMKQRTTALEVKFGISDAGDEKE